MALDNQLVEEIRAVGRKVDEMRIQLLGSAEAETEHGRLPRLEKTVDKHEVRIDDLEKADVHRKGYVKGAAAVGAAVGSVVGALIAYGMHAFELVKK